MKKVYIRTDGNFVVGLGHIMRCSSIAEALCEKGIECCFIVSSQESLKLVKEKNFSYIQLDSVWNDLEKELGKIIEVIKQENIKVLLVDSYYVTEKYLKELKQYTKLIYLTGFHKFHYPVNMLINYNIFAGDMGYREEYDSETYLAIGTNYTPLRKEFQKGNSCKKGKKGIFLTTGGTDLCHFVPALLKYLLDSEFRTWKIHIIIGTYYEQQEIDILEDMKKKNKNMILYSNVKNMSEIMQECSIAVSAAGTTLYELCAMGIPTVTFSFVDNQIRSSECFAEKKVMKSVGDIRQLPDKKAEEIVCELLKYIQDECLYKQYSESMKKLIDGKGSERLANLIINKML